MPPAIPPPTLTANYDVAVVGQENAPPASFQPKLAVWPSSGKDAPAILPQIFGLAVVPGESAPSVLPPSTLLPFSPPGSNVPANLPKIFAVVVVPGEDAPLDLLPPEPRRVVLVRETSPGILP